jgi:hypothetical protein
MPKTDKDTPLVLQEFFLEKGFCGHTFGLSINEGDFRGCCAIYGLEYCPINGRHLIFKYLRLYISVCFQRKS